MMIRCRFIIYLTLSLCVGTAFSQQHGLIGARDGLYTLGETGSLKKIFGGTDVRKIIRGSDGFFFLTGRGIVFSADLVSFEEKNSGIPVKTIKTFFNGAKAFTKEIQELKDLEIDPYDASTLVTCTKDSVFISRNAGSTWQALPSPAPQPGIKAVAVTSQPSLLVFASHAIKGPYVRAERGAWRAIAGDLIKNDPEGNPDEISDLAIEARPEGPVLWAANTFSPRIYKYGFSSSVFRLQYKDERDFACFDSLAPRGGDLLFVSDGTLMRMDTQRGIVSAAPAETAALMRIAAGIPSQLEAAYMPAANGMPAYSLSELWLLSYKDEKPHKKHASGRNGLYLQTGFVRQASTLKKYDELLTQRGLDTIVIDLKDDYGRLRFTPKDPLVKSIGRTVNPIDVEDFVSTMKAKGRYLIARIVVFKDKGLYHYAGGKYAVWDGKLQKPWQGYLVQKTEVPVPLPEGAPPSSAAPATQIVSERKYYDEFWVDPYCEKVWEYNAAIAKEIIARGFDEVQFDYIRFPTDGVNLSDARYRYKDAGMDMESALMSFLQYTRSVIDAPISIDIYGANGWYRSGVRTGQDVELLSRYVDVICPMFYPSHFEQNFLAHPPAEQRPYRIYKLGTLRTAYIARKKIVSRPYVQAFYLPVSYDKKFYSPAYVALEVDGVRDAGDDGLLFWNNAGRYDDIPVLPPRPRQKVLD